MWNNLCVQSLHCNAFAKRDKNETIAITTAAATTGAAAAAATATKLGIENIHVHITFESFQEQWHCTQCAIGQQRK